jgi:hypothetical protein
LLDPADEQQDRPPVIQNGQVVRDSYRLDRFHLERLPQLLRDPVATLQSQYGNALLTTADAHAMADKLFPRVMRLLRSLGVTCRYGFDPDDAAFLGDAGALMAHSLIIYVDDPLNGIAAEAGLVLSLSAADQGDLGLVISPFGTIAVQQTGRAMDDRFRSHGRHRRRRMGAERPDLAGERRHHRSDRPPLRVAAVGRRRAGLRVR